MTIWEFIRSRNGQLRNLASVLVGRPELVRHFTLGIIAAPPWRGTKTEYSENLEESDERSPELAEFDHSLATVTNASILSKEEKIACLGQFSPTHNSHYDLIPTLVTCSELPKPSKICFTRSTDHQLWSHRCTPRFEPSGNFLKSLSLDCDPDCDMNSILLGPWHLLLASMLSTSLRSRRSSLQRLITDSSVPVSSTYAVQP